MANNATPTTLSANDDAITVYNQGSPYQGDVQAVFSGDGTFTTAVIIIEVLKSSDDTVWEPIAVMNLKTPAGTTSGNISLTNSTAFGFVVPFCASYYGKRMRLASIATGSIAAKASGLAPSETIALPMPIAITTASVASTITAASANAFTVGANGTTNPALNIDSSAGSVATGLNIAGAAAASGLALSVLSSGTDENVTFNAKGAGTVTINNTATGAITLGRATTITTGALTISSGNLAMTSGNAVLTSGNLTLTSGNAVLTAGNLTLTSGNAILTAGNLTITSGNVISSSTGIKIGTHTSSQKLSFFNATCIVQPVANTDTSTGASGSGTAVYLNTTFTGASGSAAFTIGGMATALKALGLLAA